MPEPIPQYLAHQVPIIEQFIVGFTAAALDGSAATVNKRIDTALATLLQEMPATLLRKHVTQSRDRDRVYFALAVIRLDGPRQTLADLEKEIAGGKEERKPGYQHLDWSDRNAPVALDQFNDRLFPQQWALRRMGVHRDWTAQPSGQRITVAIVDSGLRCYDGTLHGDLNAGRVEAVADCQPAGFFADNVDRDGHGTLLAGTIEAWTDNAAGVSSAVPDDWNVTLMPVKFFSPEEPPDAANAAVAITHAATHLIDAVTGYNPVRVINASWHVAPGDGGLVALREALQLAYDNKCLVVFAAGNDGTNNEIYPAWPANFGAQAPFQGNVLTVLATDRRDGKAFFSNFGPAFVDIGAPGIHVLSTGLYLLPPVRYAEYSGTSAAAAHVSAGAALVFALNPHWQPAQVVEHLTASADLIPKLSPVCVNGRRLNLARAVGGPLRVLSPGPGTVPAAAVTNLTWAVDYNNPAFAQVAIDFVEDPGGAVFAITPSVPIAPGTFAWTPNNHPLPPLPAIGRIRISPVGDNFAAFSDLIQVG